MLYGDSFINNFISTTQIASSFLILPIAFHHYATRGDIFNLIKKAWIFIIILMTGIIFFTLFNIDSNYENSDGIIKTTLASEGGSFHFGNLDVRGAFTYISFLVLLFPLFFILKIKRKFIIFSALSILILLMILSFKRMAFVIFFSGIIIWFFSGYLKPSKKITIAVTSSLLLLFS